MGTINGQAETATPAPVQGLNPRVVLLRGLLADVVADPETKPERCGGSQLRFVIARCRCRPPSRRFCEAVRDPSPVLAAALWVAAGMVFQADGDLSAALKRLLGPIRTPAEVQTFVWLLEWVAARMGVLSRSHIYHMDPCRMWDAPPAWGPKWGG